MPPKGGTTNGAIQLIQSPNKRPALLYPAGILIEKQTKNLLPLSRKFGPKSTRHLIKRYPNFCERGLGGEGHKGFQYSQAR